MKEYYRFSGTTLYYSHFGIGEGYGSRSINQLLADGSTIQTVNLDLPNAYANGPEPILETRYTAALFEHIQQLKADGNLIRTDSFYDWKLLNVATNLPAEVLTDEALNLEWEGLGGAKDEVSIGFVQLDYPATPNADNAASYTCRITPTGGRQYLEVANFSGTTAIVYDLANAHRIVVNNISGGLLRVALPLASQPRELRIIGLEDNLPTPQISTANLDLPELGDASYIILTHSLLRAGGDDPVQAYANYRASAIGGSYQTAVVNIDDLFDQFGYGVQQHPIAIRNFIAWQRKVNPAFQYLFIIGKGREYINLRTPENLSAALGTTLFVPSFGYPASDNLLASRIDKPTPLVSLGRLPAINPEEVRLYLNKIQGMETFVANSPQTIEGRSWMKNVLHLGGGSSPSEQQSIKNNLENMGREIEQGLFGGKVTSFYKTSTDPIQSSQSEGIFGRINEGVSILTFFGHASAGTFDFNIDNPENYNNISKYPLMLSLGCYSGNMFDSFRSIGERFIFLENSGAGVYGASRGLGFIHALSNFGRYFYEQMSTDLYGRPIGDGIRATISNFENFTDQAYGTLNEQFTIHGDPAFRLNPSSGPDFVPESTSIKFTPTILSIQNDSFQLSFSVLNLGSYVVDSISVKMHQQLPGGDIRFLKNMRIAAPAYSVDLSTKIPSIGKDAVGLNRLLLEVDAGYEILESPILYAEDNNELRQSNGELGVPFFVIDNAAKPVWPANYALVNNAELVLKAVTADALAPERDYILQLDTTPNFTFPIDQTNRFQRGGVIRWQPAIDWQESVVYYWRIAPDSIYTGGTYLWETNSFTFLNNASSGWGQGHWGQWLNGTFSDLELNEEQRFDFGIQEFNVRVRNKIWDAGDRPGLQYNFESPASSVRPWNYLDEGVAVVVYEPDDPNGFWRNPPGAGTFNAGDYGVPTGGSRVFAFPTQNIEQRENLAVFLTEIVPEDAYVLFFTILKGVEPDFMPEQWAADSLITGRNIFQILEENGGALARQLELLGSVPYTLFYKKNAGVLGEAIAPDQNGEINVDTYIPTTLSSGSYYSPIIGPVQNWEDLSWGFSGLSSMDSCQLVIYAGMSRVSLDSVSSIVVNLEDNMLDLASLNLEAFPYLQLKWQAFDEENRTPPQLTYWHISHLEPLELAFDAASYFTSSSDSLAQGATYDFSIGITNLSPVNLMDSVSVNYAWQYQSSIQQQGNTKIKAILPDSIVKWGLSLSTESVAGESQLFAEINPDDDPFELVRFNNFLNKKIYTIEDVIAPVIDVTFDGQHILEGDLVAGNTQVRIKISDENPYLPLDNPALLEVYLIQPDGHRNLISNNQNQVEFFSELSENENWAEMLFQPEFLSDGIYKLEIKGGDPSGNLAGRLLYETSFEIIKEQQISHFLPYPNPFSTQTRFVYTLTGIEPSVDINIQIMTVSGRVVKEINSSELGPLSIGTHQTEYVWDGNDNYGDRLANGVYLYRVIVKDKISGQTVKHRQSEQDVFFKNGIGKIVILR
ncbi:C25 family cysteine peptidase [Lewinella sp. LCG006]|uniref:putative type IX secretion system sortase PorU2 n=1 Tax=Lewinella sp. LCG006 TaxID=3231911 RepID=UPI0034601F7D